MKKGSLSFGAAALLASARQFKKSREGYYSFQIKQDAMCIPFCSWKNAAARGMKKVTDHAIILGLAMMRLLPAEAIKKLSE